MGDTAGRLAVHETCNGRIRPANRAIEISFHAHMAEGHFQSIHAEQSIEERRAYSEQQLKGFGGLNHAYQAGEHSQNTGFSTIRSGPGGRGFGEKAAVARRFQVRRENAGLSLKPKHRTIDVRLAQ